MNRRVVLLFEQNRTHWLLPSKSGNKKLQHFNDGQNVFDQAVKNEKRRYDNIWKVTTDHGDGCITGCLLDYQYFKENNQLFAVDLSKQALDAYPKVIRQISFTGNLERAGNPTVFFFLEEVKETVLFLFFLFLFFFYKEL